MVQALNSVASALIEALRVPDLISMGIVMKKLPFSLILKNVCVCRWSEVSYCQQDVRVWDLRGFVLIWFLPIKPSFIFLFVTLTCDPAKSC